MALMFIALAVVVVFGRRGEAGVPVIAEPIQVKDFSTTVSVSGQAEAADATQVRAAIAGQVAEVLVREGQYVREGQLLARLDDRAARQALRQAEQAEALARVEWQALTKANEDRLRQHDQEMDKARRAVASATESLVQYQTRLDRVQRLHLDGVATNQQLEEAKEQVRLAKERLTEAEAGLTALAGSTVLQNTDLAKTRLAQAERNLTYARSDLDLTLLQASQAGMILVKAAEPGMAVVPGMPLFTIGTTGRLLVKAPMDEAYVVNAGVGQPVKVTNDALPDMAFTGRVDAIAPQGQIQEKLSLFVVEIGFANRGDKLRPGMTVDCEIRTARVKKVPVAPLLAVFAAGEGKDSDRKYVFLVRNGKAKKAFVTLGLTGEAEAEIRRGLHGGEMLITGEIDTLRELKDGQAVAVKKAKTGK